MAHKFVTIGNYQIMAALKLQNVFIRVSLMKVEQGISIAEMRQILNKYLKSKLIP